MTKRMTIELDTEEVEIIKKFAKIDKVTTNDEMTFIFRMGLEELIKIDEERKNEGY